MNEEEEIKDRYGQPISRCFEPIMIKDAYWIYDTFTDQFVKTWGSNKSVWAKAAHAKNAFANAAWITIDKQSRYEVQRIG